MYWAVVDVEPLDGLGLFVRFADDMTGEVRFTPEHLTGVFEPVKDPAYVRQVVCGPRGCQKEKGSGVVSSLMTR
jgi:hypothetical protein